MEKVKAREVAIGLGFEGLIGVHQGVKVTRKFFFFFFSFQLDFMMNVLSMMLMRPTYDRR